MATATAPALSDSAPDQTWKPELHEIPVDQVDVGANVRADVGDITELAASIESNGLLSPIRVAEAGAGRYELVYGQRRLAAAKHIGLKTLPAIVDAAAKPVIDRTVAQLLENLQREDLNALDTARAYRSILDHDISQRELAGLLGISQPTIANTLAVLKQPEAIQERIAAGELTRSHVEVLAKLPTAEREEVARRVVEHKLSTRELENEIGLAADRQRAADAERDRLAKMIPEVAAKVPDVLEKAKLDPTKITLIVPVKVLREKLAADGFTVAEEPKPAPTNLYGTGAQVDPCTTSVRMLRWYDAWGSQYPPQLETVCIDDKAHREAREAAVKAAQAKQSAEWEKKRAAERKAEAEASAKEREERRVARAPIVEQLIADPELRGRVLLWALAAGGADEADDWLADQGIDSWSADVWATIEKLELADVERGALGILAAAVADNSELDAELAKRRAGAKRAAKKAKAKS